MNLHRRSSRLPTAACAVLAASLALLAGPSLRASIELSRLGTYASGSYNRGAAEIAAYDPASRRLFVVNAQAATVDVLNLADPAHPTKAFTLDVTPYGAVANSVAVHKGVVAVAVEADPKTDPGTVVFFNSSGAYLSSVAVGALPDMLTFSPNGRWLLVANEGEPNDDYSVDPEGSISIINVAKGAAKVTQTDVRTAGFAAFNAATLDPSIRVFGPGASVAQDLEPESIAVSADSRTAYVTLQENNAMAVVNIAAAQVTRLAGLGFKDHNQQSVSASVYAFASDELPAIGQTLAGQDLFLGGFSGLHFEGVAPRTGRWKFITHTDRGPNAEPTGLNRPFLLPDFTPELVRFELDRSTGLLTLTGSIPLRDSAGNPLTGLPNLGVPGGTANTPHQDEIPVDLLGTVLPLDPLGGDFEGLVVDPADGSFWMCDEYRPALYHFDATGTLIQRYVPVGAGAAAGQAAGTFGEEVLPSVLAQRRQNRGFEAIALQDGKLYAFVQSPLRNPASLANSALNAMRNVRLVEFNPANHVTRQFLYLLDNADLGGGGNTRADKIGDAVARGNGQFLVIERDDDKVGSDDAELIEKRIYCFDLVGATDITGLDAPVDVGGGVLKTVDQMTPAELAAQNIQPIRKTLEVDLNAAGYNAVEKVEGLALIDLGTLAVINDNDFGVASIQVNDDGSFTLAPGYTPEPVLLGIIERFATGLDASDRDNAINIRPWPVKGMYQPDAIAAFSYNPSRRNSGATQTLLVMANEGDARDYETFAEEARVRDLVLDPVAFPDAAALRENTALGRLTVTTQLGDPDRDGDYDELYAFGARSISIRTTTGALVWDSGDDLEQLTAAALPAHFNADNAGSNNNRDNRSDNKGPEPEGLVVGKAYGRTYAFVGLERIGGVVVCDITDPTAPRWITYVNNRDFSQAPDSGLAGDLGPEGLVFIRAEDSPNGSPLLIVANEISGTTTVFQVDQRP